MELPGISGGLTWVMDGEEGSRSRGEAGSSDVNAHAAADRGAADLAERELLELKALLGRER